MKSTYNCACRLTTLLGLWNLYILGTDTEGSKTLTLYMFGLYLLGDGLDLPTKSFLFSG